jgi:hypothetical protein
MAVAAAAVNVFKTITHTVGLSTVGIYTAPIGYTGVKDLAIPPSDTANLLSGKLVIETGDSLTIVGSNATDLQYLSSVLETSNL